jgi:hypothetical protein
MTGNLCAEIVHLCAYWSLVNEIVFFDELNNEIESESVCAVPEIHFGTQQNYKKLILSFHHIINWTFA